MQREWELFYRKFITYNGYENVLNGLWITVQIAVLGLVIGILIGMVIAVIKMVPKDRTAPKIFSFICDIYIGFFRGTPIVVQLLIGYFVLMPSLGLNLPNVAVAIAVFGMNSGAYVSETMRSGIQAVDIGQLEAARALGHTALHALSLPARCAPVTAGELVARAVYAMLQERGELI